MDGTANTSGFTTTGTTIAFSRVTSVTSTFGGIATVTGTYDKQGGAGNITAFTLALTLSQVCTVSAKVMNTSQVSISNAATSGSTYFSIFNGTYFKYTDNTTVANLFISSITIPEALNSYWSWFHPDWNGDSNQYSGANLASFGSMRLSYSSGESGSFTNTITVNGAYDDFLGNYVSTTKEFVLSAGFAPVNSGGGGGGGGGGEGKEA